MMKFHKGIYRHTKIYYEDGVILEVGKLEYAIHKCNSNKFTTLYNHGVRFQKYYDMNKLKALELLFTTHRSKKIIEMYEFLLGHEYFKDIKLYSTDIDEPSILTMIRNHWLYFPDSSIFFEYFIKKHPGVLKLRYGPDEDPFLIFMAKGEYMQSQDGWICFPENHLSYYIFKNKQGQSLRDVALIVNKKWKSCDIYEQKFIDFLIEHERKSDLYVRKIQRWYLKNHFYEIMSMLL